MPSGAHVRSLFAGIADSYDRVNRVLSLGVDRGWRRAAVRFAELQSGESVLDVCSGTGDLSVALACAGGNVVGTDFCPQMLDHAAHKSAGQGRVPPRYVAGDAQHLPFADDTFDLATIAFGIRNVEDTAAGLREIVRVVRPGGRVVVLEFCKPRLPVLSALYFLYFRRILPRLGSWIAGDRKGAYDHLRDSVMAFPERQEFLQLMTEAGMSEPRMRILTGGIAALYRGEVG